MQVQMRVLKIYPFSFLKKALFILISTCFMLPPSSASAKSFSGQYQGNINGTPSTLTLQQNGNQLKGEIDAGGYKYVLQGQVSQQQAQGQFIDPATGVVNPFIAIKQQNNINLQLQVPGQAYPLTLQFYGGQATSSTPSYNRQNQTQGNYSGQLPDQSQQQSQAYIERDSALVGRWRQSNSMTSGSYSGVVETSMTINPDGSYRYGDGKFAGGGAGGSGHSYGGDATMGKWKTQNRIIYIQEGGNQWQPYARYYVENNKMMLTFDDNSKQIWYRIQ